MSYEQERWDRRQALLLRAVANLIYQQARQRRLEFLEQTGKAASLIAGSYAFAKVSNPEIVQWCAIVVVAFSVLSLVFGWGTRARDAAKRGAEWSQLEREIEAAGLLHYTDSQLDSWSARAAQNETGEAAQSAPLWAQSYTQACKVLKLTPEKPFSRWQRRPAFFVP